MTKKYHLVCGPAEPIAIKFDGTNFLQDIIAKPIGRLIRRYDYLAD